MKHLPIHLAAAAALSLGLAIACGGGGGSSSPSSTGTPSTPTPTPTPTAKITSALSGTFGGSGTLEGTGSTARLEDASGIAIDAQGNVYSMGDEAFHTLQRISPQGVVKNIRKGTAIESAWYGQDQRACGPVAINDGFLIYSQASNVLYKVSLDGTSQSTIALPSLGLSAGEAVVDLACTDGTGNTLYFLTGSDPYLTDHSTNVPTRLLKVASGSLSVLNSGSSQVLSKPIHLDGSGTLYASTLTFDTNSTLTPSLFYVSSSGSQGLITFTGLPDAPSGMNQTLRMQNYLPTSNGFVAAISVSRSYQAGSSRPRQGMVLFTLDPAGVATPLAGSLETEVPTNGGYGTGAFGASVQGIVPAPSGGWFVKSTAVLQSVATDGTISLVAGCPILQDLVDGSSTAARYQAFAGSQIAVDASGNVYLPDGGYSLNSGINSGSIRKISTDGSVSLYAGSYSTIGSDDGTLGTNTLVMPRALAIDANGTLWFLQSTSSSNTWALRKAVSGVVTTVTTFTFAPSVSTPSSMAIDPSGNFVVAVNWSSNGNKGAAVYSLTSSGGWSLLGGNTSSGGLQNGNGVSATFTQINALAVDATGNIYLTEDQNLVRKLSSSGVVTTLAGSADTFGSTDGVSALFSKPWGIAVKSDGSVVYVADLINGTIRAITASGSVSTIAGNPGSIGPSWGTALGSLPHPASLVLSKDQTSLYVTTDGGLFKVSGL